MAVTCPLCKHTMVALQAGPVEIDFCRLGCKGLWFDVRELPLLEVPSHQVSQALTEALQAPARVRLPEALRCPRCDRRLASREYRGTRITVDACEFCGGYFLDPGELAMIQRERGMVGVAVNGDPAETKGPAAETPSAGPYKLQWTPNGPVRVGPGGTIDQKPVPRPARTPISSAKEPWPFRLLSAWVNHLLNRPFGAAQIFVPRHQFKNWHG